ncbi:MAG: beta-ketoacyl-ACP synthase 3 [Bryobacteraceae bacterium]
MRIAGVGSAIPPAATSNPEIETRLGLEPGWIERRTGILARPTTAPGIATSDLAAEAGCKALQSAGLPPGDVGLLLLATSTPDHLLPPTAPLVAHRLRLTQAGAIDLTGACSGFLYALAIGSACVASMNRPVVVIGANILTRRVNERDPATVALFADGAGAAVLVPSETPHLLGQYLGADGSHYDAIKIPAGGTREPLTSESLQSGRNLMQIQDGPRSFKHAVRLMATAGRQALSAAALTPDAIGWWIPHQANLRLIRETGKALGIPNDRTIVTIDRYANSSAATIPIALAQAVAANRIHRGDTLLLTSVGAGMINAGLVLKW